MTFNRDLFLASHKTKLFTASEVVKFIEMYSSTTSAEQVLDEMMNTLVSSRFETDGKIIVEIGDVRIALETAKKKIDKIYAGRTYVD